MTGQTILTVGAHEQFATIGAAITAANQMGGNADIRLDGGTYYDDGGAITADNVTVEGTGPISIIERDTSFGSSAGIASSGHNVLLKNLALYCQSTSTFIGAGIRYGGGTLTLDGVEVSDFATGLLADGDPTGSITVRNSDFRYNGGGVTGLHAQIDVGDVASFLLTNSFVHGPNGATGVRSRAENSVIVGNVIDDNYYNGGYAIDLPSGGNAVIDGNSMQHVDWGGYGTVLSYGEKGMPHSGRAVEFKNNLVFNGDPTDPAQLWSNYGAVITASGNTEHGITDLGTGVAAAGVSALPVSPNPDQLELDKMASMAARASTDNTLHPKILAITGVPYTGVRLSGTAEAGATVAIIDTVSVRPTLLGTATAGSNGSWSFTSVSGLGHIDLASVHQYSALAWDGVGRSGATPGALFLTDTGRDVLSGTAGAADVFAIMSNSGTDVINGFEATGANHDVLNFSGRGVGTFGQVQAIMSGGSSTVFTLPGGKTVTLTGVAPSTLVADDFRFS